MLLMLYELGSLQGLKKTFSFLIQLLIRMDKSVPLFMSLNEQLQTITFTLFQYLSTKIKLSKTLIRFARSD